jgi:hypothetical protein
MRAVECPCGEHFEASTDAEVLVELTKHADENHPDEYSESDLRLVVNTSAYDAAA